MPDGRRLLLSSRLAIRFAPPIRVWGWLCGRFTGEGSVGVGICGQGTLEESVEEQAAVA